MENEDDSHDRCRLGGVTEHVMWRRAGGVQLGTEGNHNHPLPSLTPLSLTNIR